MKQKYSEALAIIITPFFILVLFMIELGLFLEAMRENKLRRISARQKEAKT